MVDHLHTVWIPMDSDGFRTIELEYGRVFCLLIASKTERGAFIASDSSRKHCYFRRIDLKAKKKIIKNPAS